MKPAEARSILDCANQLGEGPLWCPREQVLWWIDIVGVQLWRYAPSSGRADHWPLPKRPGSFALRESGGLLFAFQKGFATLDVAGGEFKWRHVAEFASGDERFNDGRVDAAGRFWVGTLDRTVSQPVGQLYRFDTGFALSVMDRGFTVSNGIGWSPDNRIMYFTDTRAHRIYRYDFDLTTGQISTRRTFAAFEPGHGGPDGMTVDADGYVWSAQFDRWCLHRYASDGRLDRVVPLPVQRPTACAFGGPDLTTLYVTTASTGLPDDARQTQPLSGHLLALEPGVHGLPESRYGA